MRHDEASTATEKPYCGQKKSRRAAMTSTEVILVRTISLTTVQCELKCQVEANLPQRFFLCFSCLCGGHEWKERRTGILEELELLRLLTVNPICWVLRRDRLSPAGGVFCIVGSCPAWM